MWKTYEIEKSIETIKKSLGISYRSRRVVLIGHKFRRKSGMHHYLLVLMNQETKVSIMARTHSVSELDQHSLKVVWHKEVVGLVYALSVVETTQVNVMRDRHVASSVDKRVTLSESTQRIWKVMETWTTNTNFHQLLN